MKNFEKYTDKEVPNLFISFGLWVLAEVLALTVGVLGETFTIIYIVFSKEYKLKRYFFGRAKSKDQHKNFTARFFWDTLLIKDKSDINLRFGNMDDSISSNIGENEKAGNLSLAGKFLNLILNKIDPGHSIDAIEENEI
jgi:hypothetical protein